MKKIFIAILLLLFTLSCQTKMNQYIKVGEKSQKRHGKWKEEYPTNEGTLVAIGKYKKGEKIGVWKTYFDNKLYQKESIRKDITKVKRYFPTGSIMEKGQTKLEISQNERHWFYSGAWKYYDDKENLLYTKKYYKESKADSIPARKKQ
jgi:antitoxin component YwqK of YwqJK toxin-antitoxin module